MLNNLLKSIVPKSFDNPSKNINSEIFEVNNWIVSDFVSERLVPIVGVRPFPLNELMLMTATVCRFKPEIIFEWGTNIGKSARVFYEITKAFNISSQIHSIDLPDDVFHNEHPKNKRGRMVKNFKTVTLHQGDGISCSLKLINDKKPKGKVLFFVDGDHSYESVKKELETILREVPDAIVLLHDTFFQSKEANYNIGPFEAISEVMKKTDNKYHVLSTNMGLPGMSLVYKK